MTIGKLKINAFVKIGVLNSGKSISEIVEDVFLNPPCVCQRDVDARIGDFVHALREAGVSTVRGTTTFDPVEIVKLEGWEFDCGAAL